MSDERLRQQAQQEPRSIAHRESSELAEVPGEVQAEEARDAHLKSTGSAPDTFIAALAHADGAGRERIVSRLQQAHGNAFVQRLVATLAPSSGHPALVQRDGEGESSGSRFRLTTPSLLGPAGASPSPSSAYQLHLDPEIQFRIQAMQLAHQLLDPTALRAALLRIEPGAALTAPSPLAGPSAPAAEPLVPRGEGPETPRAAGAGDALSAVMAVPLIDTAITNLQTLALDRVRSDYRRLSTGERIAAISASVLIGGTAIAGIASNPDARRFALGQLNGRVFPVPGVSGLSVELNTERDGVMVGLHLDVGALLPKSLGFGPSSPTPIGGPP